MLLWLLGIILIIWGVVNLVQAQILSGVILLVVGLALAGYLGFGGYNGR